MPLSVSEKRFKYFTVDFVTDLLLFINTHREVYINVIIIVDCFFKYATFVPMWKIDGVSVGHTWLTEFYWENGASDFIVSDCGPQFINDFWKQVCFHININVKLSTAFHSETDN